MAENQVSIRLAFRQPFSLSFFTTISSFDNSAFDRRKADSVSCAFAMTNATVNAAAFHLNTNLLLG